MPSLLDALQSPDINHIAALKNVSSKGARNIAKNGIKGYANN